MCQHFCAIALMQSANEDSKMMLDPILENNFHFNKKRFTDYIVAFRFSNH